MENKQEKMDELKRRIQEYENEMEIEGLTVKQKEEYDALKKELEELEKTIEEQETIDYEGVEKENPHAIEYQLNDWEKDKFLELKEELSKTEDPDRAAEIRKEMADILGKSYKDRAEKEETKKDDKEVKSEEKEEKKENKTMSAEERKAKINFITGKLAEFQKRYAAEIGKDVKDIDFAKLDINNIDLDNITDEKLKGLILNIPIWQAELESLKEAKKDEQAKDEDNQTKEENEQENPEKLGILKSDIEKRLLEYDETQKGLLSYSDGEDTMPDKDKREYERINNVKLALKELLDLNSETEYVSIEEIDRKIQDYKEKRQAVWETVVGAGDGATPKEAADLTRYDDIVKELEDLKERCKAIEDKDNDKGKDDSNKKDSEPTKEDNQPKKEDEDPRANYAKDGFQPPAVRDLPNIDINLNVKTGECKVEAPGYVATNIMNKFNYERKYLKKLHKNIASAYPDIAKEDLEYLDKVDPTLYEAYKTFDEKNEGKYNDSAAEVYVKSVIEREKQLEKGEETKGKKVPGKVKVSYKTPEVDGEDKRVGYEKFKGLPGAIAKFRAKRLLNHHGPKGLDLAEVEKKRNLLKGILAGLGIGTVLVLGTGNPEPEPTPEPTPIEHEEENTVPDIPEIPDPIIIQDEKEDPVEDKVEDTNYYIGDIVNAKGADLYYRSNDNTPNGKMQDDSLHAINKIAIVDPNTNQIVDSIPNGKQEVSQIDKESQKALYDRAKAEGLKVVYHIDEATMENGQICVRAFSTGKMSPVKMYQDENGNAIVVESTKQGFETTTISDIPYGKGWVQEDVVKQENQNTVQYENATFDSSDVKYTSTQEMNAGEVEFSFQQGPEGDER